MRRLSRLLKVLADGHPRNIRCLRPVKRRISSGGVLSLSHPNNCSSSRDVCKCWCWKEQRIVETSSSSQSRPIPKYFKRVRQSKPSDRWLNFGQRLISNLNSLIC
ncbi:hypothetical protein ACJW30_05G099800 [Castanea mollissima]